MGAWSVRSGSVACESYGVCVSRYTVSCCIVSAYCGPIQREMYRSCDTSAFGIHPFDAVSGLDTSDTAALAWSHGRISIHLFRYINLTDTLRYTIQRYSAIHRIRCIATPLAPLGQWSLSYLSAHTVDRINHPRPITQALQQSPEK